MHYAWYPVQDFESYLTIVVVSDEHDFRLILKYSISNFLTDE